MKFEDYLKRKHALSYVGTDDDMPEAFDHWLSQLDVQEVIDFAEEWGEELSREVRAVTETK